MIKKTIFPLLWLCGIIAVVVSQNSTTTEQQAMEALIENLKLKTAQQPSNAELWFSLGIAYHDLCNKYMIKCAKDAVQALERASKLRNDAVTLAYLGSAWTLVGRDEDNPLLKIDGVLKGLTYLDSAVKLSPSDVIVRRIRYENNFALPDIFDRKKIVEEDLNFLVKLYAKDPTVFEGKYDAAHVFYYKARMEFIKKDWKSAQRYASIAKAIVKDKDLAIEIENFLKGGK
ncbi:MAG: hypothetical protein N2Z76_06105 [Treponemataceae bacterium]|nr:hypothetical protein [Treponemataceae bacterium]